MRRASGEGSIFQRKAKGKVQWIAVTPHPECRRFTSTKSQAHAIAKRTTYLKSKRGGLAKASSKQPLGEYLLAWFDSARNNYAPNTVASYESAIRLHISPHIGEIALGKLGPQHIQAMMDSLTEYAPNTQNRARLVAKVALDQAVTWELIPSNPVMKVKPRKANEPTIRIQQPESHAKWLAYLDGHDDEALALLFSSPGVRKCEVLGLTWASVRWAEGHIAITQQLHRSEKGKAAYLRKLKTPKSYRIVPLTKRLVSSLRRRRAQQLAEKMKAGEGWRDTLGLVFTQADGRPRGHTTTLQRIKSMQKEAGIDPVTIRGLRHTAATMLLRARVPVKTVQAILGHASAKTTLDVYGHLVADMLDEAAVAMDRMGEL